MKLESHRAVAAVAVSVLLAGMGCSSDTGSEGRGTADGASGAQSGSGGALNGGSGGASNASGGTASGGDAAASGGDAAGVGGDAAGTGGDAAGVGGDVAGTGGNADNSAEADPSPGCGTVSPSDCLPCTSNDRPYYVDMPDDYDPNRPYPVVFKYHPLGGSAQGARNMYLGNDDFEAIYVSQDGSDNGFPNAGGADEQMTRDIMADIEARLCVDRARYFATGFSYGGSMSYTAACNMSDKFRAVASMAGAPISGAACTSQEPERPVAVLGIHEPEPSPEQPKRAKPNQGSGTFDALRAESSPVGVLTRDEVSFVPTSYSAC